MWEMNREERRDEGQAHTHTHTHTRTYTCRALTAHVLPLRSICRAAQVWDLAQGACVQTVLRAHDNAITSVMGWGEVRHYVWGQFGGAVHAVTVSVPSSPCVLQGCVGWGKQ